MPQPIVPLEVVSDWPLASDPWTPPVFVATAVWRLLVAADIRPTPAWCRCDSDLEAVSRAAGCAWAWARAGHPAPVHAAIAGGLDPRAINRLRSIAGERLRVTAVGPQPPGLLPPDSRWCALGSAPALDALLPPARHQWPAVDLPTVAMTAGGCFARSTPQPRPLQDAVEALHQLAGAEDSLLVPDASPLWRPGDAIGLWATAQLAGSGWRPAWAGDIDPVALRTAMPAIGDAGLPLVVVATLDAAALADCAAVEGWWIAEAADRPGLHAVLATALQDAVPWLIRVPTVWIPDLAAPQPGPWEPGAGRLLTPVAERGRWLVCTAAGLGRARAIARAAQARGIQLTLLQAASLRPFPWQAASGPCAVLEEPGSDLLTTCARHTGRSVHRLDDRLAPAAALTAWLEAERR